MGHIAKINIKWNPTKFVKKKKICISYTFCMKHNARTSKYNSNNKSHGLCCKLQQKLKESELIIIIIEAKIEVKL